VRYRSKSPIELRYPVYLLTILAACLVLGLAGFRFSVTVACGAAAGLIAELAVEVWWVRRERRRDRANHYVATPPADEP
jgi:hypothetical protein